jgi:hypothetical protein
MNYQMIANNQCKILEEMPNDPLSAEQHLTAITGDLQTQLFTIGTYIHHISIEIEKSKKKETILRKQRQHLEDKVTMLRNYCLMSLTKNNLKSIQNTYLQLSIGQKRPSVTIDNVSKLPSMYIARMELYPDKAQIRHSLLQGITVPGAHLDYGSRLIITPIESTSKEEGGNQ